VKKLWIGSAEIPGRVQKPRRNEAVPAGILRAT
jgi:hypothetical protein